MRRAEVEITITMWPTGGQEPISAVSRACPVVVPTELDSRDDVVATIHTATASLVDGASLALVELAEGMARGLVAAPPDAARPRDVGINGALAGRIKAMYGRNLSAVDLDVLPLGSVVEVTTGRHKGRHFMQEGAFRLTHQGARAIETSAWRDYRRDGQGFAVRMASELVFIGSLRLVHAPGAPNPIRKDLKEGTHD